MGFFYDPIEDLVYVIGLEFFSSCDMKTCSFHDDPQFLHVPYVCFSCLFECSNSFASPFSPNIPSLTYPFYFKGLPLSFLVGLLIFFNFIFIQLKFFLISISIFKN